MIIISTPFLVERYDCFDIRGFTFIFPSELRTICIPINRFAQGLTTLVWPNLNKAVVRLVLFREFNLGAIRIQYSGRFNLHNVWFKMLPTLKYGMLQALKAMYVRIYTSLLVVGK